MRTLLIFAPYRRVSFSKKSNVHLITYESAHSMGAFFCPFIVQKYK
jgi:hypothetical protein